MELNQLRKSKNLTQLELAKMIGTARTTIAMLETNKAKPSLDTAKKLAEALDVDVAVIFACFYGEPKEIEI